MPKSIDVQKIIKDNPNVDRDLFQRGQRAISELRRHGISKSGYNLVAPFDSTGKRRPNPALHPKSVIIP